MRTRSLVDTELLPLLDSFPAFGLSDGSLDEARRSLARTRVEGPEVAVSTTQHLVPGTRPGQPDVVVWQSRPVAAQPELPAIFHCHGGGYVMGSAAIAEPGNRQLAAALGCAVFSVEYRLAPETQHPGPIEDCYTALEWLFRNAKSLGAGSLIGLKGESAGGGLAAALALLTRDRAEFKLAFQQLIYPMLDDRTCVNSDISPFVGEFIWTRADNRYGWRSLLGGEPGVPGISPYAAAARADDLSGLPPTFISVGGLDLFLEENLEYARRLARAAVPLALHVYPGAYHGFGLVASSSIARQAATDTLGFLRKMLVLGQAQKTE